MRGSEEMLAPSIFTYSFIKEIYEFNLHQFSQVSITYKDNKYRLKLDKQMDD